MEVRFMIYRSKYWSISPSFNRQMNTMLKNHYDHVKNKDMTEDLLLLVGQRTKLTTEKLQLKSRFHMYYHHGSPLGLFWKSH